MPVDERRTGYQFGAFKGVFTPSILTILGVIMYLRLGWVLGNLGLPLTLITVTVACSVTFLTGLSLSAIASNMKIGGGGAYYIISRSLGLEAGAAIGLPLFLAQSLGIAFYISGFSEALVDSFDFMSVTALLPFSIDPARFVAIVTLLILTVLAFISADLALKTQFLIMAAIAVSLFSFFSGAAAVEITATAESVPPKLGFWVVFAVFFPAVTGIEAGLAMSGDLKDPAKSLPRGTLAAVITGFLVYLLIPILLDRIVVDKSLLLTRPLIMRDVARWGGLILLGVWAASLSSALGALLGAPRTLQALARDNIIPRFIGRGFGASNDPRTATVISFLVALCAVLLGDLNMIAPVLSMFFLLSYGLINFSAGMECLISSPSWRPSFKLWWGLALLGAGGCFSIMFMINAGATFLAWVVAVTVYLLMKRRRLNTQWGDLRYGILMLMLRFSIARLLQRKPDERGWRPNILAFSGSPELRRNLVDIGQALAQDPASLTLATVVPAEAWSSDRVLKLQLSMSEYIAKHEINAMVKVFQSDSVLNGVMELIKGYGFGPIIPNTILLGEIDVSRNVDKLVKVIQLVHYLQRNFIQIHEPENPADASVERRIDIWWRGGEENIGIMITLAYLLSKNEEWRKTRLVVKRIVDVADDDKAEIRKNINDYFSGIRLDAEVKLLDGAGRSAFELIHESSADAALVLMGLRSPAGDEQVDAYEDYYQRLIGQTEGLPLVLVMAAEKIQFKQLIGME